VQPVVVPLFVGVSVEAARERAAAFGLDPGSPAARLVALEHPAADWEAVVTFEVGAGGVVPTGVEVRSTRGEPVTRGVWDRVRLAAVIDEAARLVAWLGPVNRHPERAQPFETRPQHRGRAKGRPFVYSDDHYRRVGRVYRAAEVAGAPPVRAVALAFAGAFPGLTDPTDRRARSWVRAARARGYIADEEAQP